MDKKTDEAFEALWQEKQGETSVAYIKGVKALCKEFYKAGLTAFSAVTQDEIVPQDFLDWWKTYDLAVNRKDCLKKWLKLTDEEKKACMAYTPAYVEATPEKQYRKRPLTFLNQKAWNDEIIYRNGNKPTAEQQRQQQLEGAARIVARYTGSGDGDKE